MEVWHGPARDGSGGGGCDLQEPDPLAGPEHLTEAGHPLRRGQIQAMGATVRKVAVKTLLSQFAKDPQTVARTGEQVSGKAAAVDAKRAKVEASMSGVSAKATTTSSAGSSRASRAATRSPRSSRSRRSAWTSKRSTRARGKGGGDGAPAPVLRVS